ncbi:chromate efflux transporter [Negadavirga shengliensis]|uniref:Chromate efflux transporter n=1 Tax=Negadavirga shengliensis TaxID=1389218 RepID=A0ABV9T5N2_9BACT
MNQNPDISPAGFSDVSFREALKVWIKVALYSFGGPAGQIAVMHRFLVDEKKWIDENRFLHTLNYCMLLPGPEAQQLSIYLGWLMHGLKGGLVAGSLFVLPGFISILILSILYAEFSDVTLVQAIFYGIKPAVMAIVVQAVFKIGSRALKNGVMVSLSVLSFIAIFFFDIAFPLIVLTAGLTGLAGGKIWEDKFYVIKGHTVRENGQSSPTGHTIRSSRPSFRRTLKTVTVWLLIWLVPLAVLFLVLGDQNVFVQEGVFFSKAAVVTFGGAYSVLAYIAQEAVQTHGWLMPGQMLDGLGMAETTPGPLIQVVQFVGFMGAYQFPGALDPVVAGILASVLVTWMTFVPCFLFILSGAPYIEYLRGNKSLTTALSAITAAVVGVVLNLGVWFSIHTLFGEVRTFVGWGLNFDIPVWDTVDWWALIIAVGAFVALFRYKINMLTVLGASVALGILVYFLT